MFQEQTRQMSISSDTSIDYSSLGMGSSSEATFKSVILSKIGFPYDFLFAVIPLDSYIIHSLIMCIWTSLLQLQNSDI